MEHDNSSPGGRRDDDPRLIAFRSPEAVNRVNVTGGDGGNSNAGGS
jgi:hypothetical protein